MSECKIPETEEERINLLIETINMDLEDGYVCYGFLKMLHEFKFPEGFKFPKGISINKETKEATVIY